MIDLSHVICGLAEDSLAQQFTLGPFVLSSFSVINI